jgi:hypothetical protein
MRLKFIIPLLTFLALGGCAVNSDRVPANFVSAKQYVFSGCRELSEDMAKENYTVSHSKNAREIAEAKGDFDALVRAGYDKHCGEYERPQAPAPAQIVVIQPPAPPAPPAPQVNYQQNYAPPVAQYQPQYQYQSQPQYQYPPSPPSQYQQQNYAVPVPIPVPQYYVPPVSQYAPRVFFSTHGAAYGRGYGGYRGALGYSR